MLEVYFVRHGQTEANAQGIIQGFLDTELNETGFAQADRASQRLANVHFDKIFTSPLKRAYDTAASIARRQGGLCEMILSHALKERDMGEYSGTKRKIVHPLPASVESGRKFAKRCSDWFETDVVPLTTAGHARILVVSHGAFLSTLFQLFLLPKAKGGRFGFAAESDIRLGICANTSISIIRLDSDGEGRIISYNDMQHILPNEDVAGRDLAA